MGHFLSDLERSREAVNSLMSHYEELGFEVKELTTREEQKNGDFRLAKENKKINVEVKFDEMASKTGNLCFEMSNGSKMTGIMGTGAEMVIYAVPYSDGFHIYVFNTKKLRKFITDPANVEIRNGGDKRRFVLALAKATTVVDAGVPEETFDLIC